MSDRVKVMFVCLGNICRSPMAEGLFLDKVKKAGLEDRIEVASSGTSGWHQGELPDRRMREVAKNHGVVLPSRSQALVAEDAVTYDYLIPMDRSNQVEVVRLVAETAGSKAQVFKMRDFDQQAKGADVPDPYYGGDRGFEEVYEMLDRSTAELLQHIRTEKRL
ncbi:MAG: low molecular weight protein-tyrosine-phosphatase [Bacteroidota bacterium]